MTAPELRASIHRQIDAIEDEGVLALLRDVIINLESKDSLDLPDSVVERINLGLKDIREGRVLTDKQVNARVDEWFAR